MPSQRFLDLSRESRWQSSSLIHTVFDRQTRSWVASFQILPSPGIVTFGIRCPVKGNQIKIWLHMSVRLGSWKAPKLAWCATIFSSHDIIVILCSQTTTYDHTYWKIRDHVRSPLVKPVTVGVVVGSVTTSECPMLYVSLFVRYFFFACHSWQL